MAERAGPEVWGIVNAVNGIDLEIRRAGGAIRVGRPLQSALAITAVITLLLGIVPGRVIAWASESARSLLLALR